MQVQVCRGPENNKWEERAAHRVSEIQAVSTTANRGRFQNGEEALWKQKALKVNKTDGIKLKIQVIKKVRFQQNIV